MGVIIPLTPVWWKRKKVFRSRGYFQEKIQQAIAEDPEIQDKTKIAATVERAGWFGKDTLHLIGETDNPHDRERAQEIAENNARDVVEIRNDIVVNG